MVLCKRYRLVNKILVHITKPWKTFHDDEPPKQAMRTILQVGNKDVQSWGKKKNCIKRNYKGHKLAIKF